MNDLDSLEKKIDLTVLKWYNREDYRAKQERFRQTVMAAHAIVSQKLYKTKSQTVESYFRDVWKISRASVYRFLDCALVLEQLKDFPDWSKPSHERLCRSLKKLTKNPVHMRYLWKTVLLKAGENPNLITSTFIKKVWQELIVKGEIPNVSEDEENNLFKKKKGTGKNQKSSSSSSNNKAKKRKNIDQSNNCNQIESSQSDSKDFSNQYNFLSSSSSQIFNNDSISNSPLLYESSAHQSLNNMSSSSSYDANWTQDSSQSVMNSYLSSSSNSNSCCFVGTSSNIQSQNKSMGDSSENYNKYRILSPPLSTASSFSILPYQKQINNQENDLVLSNINQCTNTNDIYNNNTNSNNNKNNNNNNSNNKVNTNNSSRNKNTFIIDQSVYNLSSSSNSNNDNYNNNDNTKYSFNYTNINNNNIIDRHLNLKSNNSVYNNNYINVNNNNSQINRKKDNYEKNIIWDNQQISANINNLSDVYKPAWSLSTEIFNHINNHRNDYQQKHSEINKLISSSILNIENLL